MLAPTQRLRSSADFSSVVSRGRRAGSPALVVHLLGPDPDHGTRAPARCGFVVNKAVGNAVTRNRVVRRLRPLVRNRLPDLPEGSLMVVRALPAAAGASSAELSTVLDRCLRKLAGARAGEGATP